MRAAYLRRHESDYIFDFWTAFGWTMLTCGIYLVYVVYQLVRRSRDHNLRRLELLDAANAVAWERADRAGTGRRAAAATSSGSRRTSTGCAG